MCAYEARGKEAEYKADGIVEDIDPVEGAADKGLDELDDDAKDDGGEEDEELAAAGFEGLETG